MVIQLFFILFFRNTNSTQTTGVRYSSFFNFFFVAFFVQHSKLLKESTPASGTYCFLNDILMFRLVEI